MANQVQKRLKIVILTDWYPSSSNPVEGIFIQELARAVSKFQSVIVLHNQGADPGLENSWCLDLQENSSLTRGIKTYSFRYRPFSFPKTNLLVSIWYLIKALRRIKKAEGKPDILHTQVYTTGFMGAIAGKILGIPVVTTEHSSAFVRGHLSTSEKIKARIGFQLSKVVVLVSTALKEAII